MNNGADIESRLLCTWWLLWKLNWRERICSVVRRCARSAKSNDVYFSLYHTPRTIAFPLVSIDAVSFNKNPRRALRYWYKIPQLSYSKWTFSRVELWGGIMRIENRASDVTTVQFISCSFALTCECECEYGVRSTWELLAVRGSIEMTCRLNILSKPYWMTCVTHNA